MSDAQVKIDPDSFANSINGFEQIAIRQMFRERIDSLAEDGTMLMRALLFVQEKRDGAADTDAYRNIMLLPLEEVVSRFDMPDGYAQDDDADAVAERDKAYADFVVGVGLSFTVEQYMALTVGQKNALIEAAQRHRR